MLDISALDYIRFATGYNIRIILASEDFVKTAYDALYGSISKQEILKDIIEESESLDVKNVDEDEISVWRRKIKALR